MRPRVAGAKGYGVTLWHKMRSRRRRSDPAEWFVHLVPDAIYAAQDNRFVFCNPGALRLFGYSRDEFIGSSPAILSPPLQPCGTPSAELIAPRAQEAIRDGIARFEWQCQRKDGSQFLGLVTLLAAELGGRPTVLGTTADLTDLTQMIDGLSAGLRRIAAGDLSQSIRTAFSPRYDPVRRAFNTVLDDLRQLVGAVATSTQMIRGGTLEISTAAEGVSDRIERQAASLEQSAAALDQLTATLAATASETDAASTLAAAARGDAGATATMAQRAIAAMHEIERTSGEIGDIIGVIDGIAFQTNLLALNAGVEAARAGDAGRGFAVVAQEVRALAQRSADAARDVKQRIGAAAGQVDAGVALVDQTETALRRIVEQIDGIDQRIAQIARATRQEAEGISQLNVAVAEMSGATQQHAAMIEQTNAAAHDLAERAAQLERDVARFRLDAAATTRAIAVPARLS
jgi:methyl-accepting chemotaxis protein